MSDWISTEDRIPDEGIEILFVALGDVEKGRRYDDIYIADRTDSFNDQVDFRLDQVQHWMPLPAPPQE